MIVARALDAEASFDQAYAHDTVRIRETPADRSGQRFTADFTRTRPAARTGMVRIAGGAIYRPLLNARNAAEQRHERDAEEHTHDVDYQVPRSFTPVPVTSTLIGGSHVSTVVGRSSANRKTLVRTAAPPMP